MKRAFVAAALLFCGCGPEQTSVFNQDTADSFVRCVRSCPEPNVPRLADLNTSYFRYVPVCACLKPGEVRR